MKRRQHWDTELEQSVSAILFDCYNNGVSEEQVYQAIAAVEDWARWEHVPKGTLLRLERAEAAIARVRELIDSADNNGEWPWMLVRVSAVREILEGDKR